MDLDLQGLIPVFGGLFAILVGYGYLPAHSNPQKSHIIVQKIGAALRVLSPVIILLGVLILFKIL